MKVIMKTLIILQSFLITALIVASPVFAQTAGITQVETFIQSLVKVLVTLAGVIASLFFAWGGITYITSSGDPESLDRAKKTIMYAAIGLVIAIGALVITTVVTDLAQGAFGK